MNTRTITPWPLAACGSTPQKILPPEKPAPTPAEPPATLTIDVPMGISLIQRPTKAEGAPVTGLVSVTRHEGDQSTALADAVVELNGTVIPAASTPGFYDIGKAKNIDVVPAGPRCSRRPKAPRPSRSACPAPTRSPSRSPNRGDLLQPGAEVTISWADRTNYSSGPFAPAAGLRLYAPGDNTSLSATMDPKAPATAGTVTLPISEKTYRYQGAHGSGICVLVRRVNVYTDNPV